MQPKVCALVGIGPGLGLALARRFGREGFRVGLIARREGALASYVEGLEAEGITASAHPADAADPAALGRALAELQATHGPAEVLLYNAARIRSAMPSQVEPEELVADFRVNVAGALAAAQAALPGMKALGRGTILFTGGGLALEPVPQYAALAVGKAGIRSLALSLAKELKGEGIHVATVTICGFIAPGTPFDPDTIAEAFWTLHAQPQGSWEREIVFG